MEVLEKESQEKSNLFKDDELSKYRAEEYQGCKMFFPAGWSRKVRGSISVSPIRWIFEKCAKEHPNIHISSKILGGIPHIKGTRLSVGQVLGRIYVLGSIKDVVEYYDHDISEEGIKEAVAYAQDFVELAGESEQPETYD